MIEKIKKDLPNFPAEIIKDWLLFYANDIGWPPDHERWQGILFCKTLQFWQSVSWNKQDLNLSEVLFSRKTNEIFEGLKEAYVYNKENFFSKNNPSGERRYLNAFKYIIQEGQFPKPICILRENDQYSIVDGNHRYTAWWASRQLINEINNAEKNGTQEITNKLKKLLEEKLQVKFIAPTLINHKIWLATSNN